MFWWEKRILLLLWILFFALSVVSMGKMQFIVTLKKEILSGEVEKFEELVASLGGKVTEHFSLIGAFVVQLDAEEKANLLRQCKIVEAVEKDQVVKALDRSEVDDL
jgi:hypothetical protein